MKSEPTVAVVGVTGAVGQTMLAVLEERKFPVGKLVPIASERSEGKTIRFRGEDLAIRTVEPGCFEEVDIGLFSAGGSISETVAPKAVDEGCIVVDNTSAFRYVPEVPLVVPEVNRADIFKHRGIIANPNCSTIQMMVALKPLADVAGLKRIIVSTYQATSGAGAEAIQEMQDASRALLDGKDFEPRVFPHQIAFNALPQIDKFMEGGWTREEMKMVWETHKIMGDESIGVSATCVRIPVVNGHSESIYAEFEHRLEKEEVWKLWREAPGITVIDDVDNLLYPLASEAAGTDATFVGRLRMDRFEEKAIHFWCVSDNLRKGAALNAVQIAECLLAGE